MTYGMRAILVLVMGITVATARAEHGRGGGHAGGGHVGGGHIGGAPAFHGGAQPHFNNVQPHVTQPHFNNVQPHVTQPHFNNVQPHVRPAYTQNTVVWNNRTLIQRSYVHNNVTVNRYYHPYVYGGHTFHGFYPVHYYPHAHYSFWVGGYWHAPVVRYRWWWWYTPWYRPYVYYFQPYPSYPAPIFWLTDYVIGNILAAEYLNQAAVSSAALQSAYLQGQVDESIRQANEAAASQYATAAIGQAQKEQLKRQVTEAVNAHQQQQGASLAQALRDPNHLFAVSESIQASYPAQNGQVVACTLSPGDLIRPLSVDEANQIAYVTVVTAKQNSCPVTAQVQISLVQLAEFENNFYEQVDQGLEQLAAMPNQ